MKQICVTRVAEKRTRGRTRYCAFKHDTLRFPLCCVYKGSRLGDDLYEASSNGKQCIHRLYFRTITRTRRQMWIIQKNQTTCGCLVCMEYNFWKAFVSSNPCGCVAQSHITLKLYLSSSSLVARTCQSKVAQWQRAPVG